MIMEVSLSLCHTRIPEAGLRDAVSVMMNGDDTSLTECIAKLDQTGHDVHRLAGAANVSDPAIGLLLHDPLMFMKHHRIFAELRANPAADVKNLCAGVDVVAFTAAVDSLFGDSLTLHASFVGPDILGEKLAQEFGKWAAAQCMAFRGAIETQVAQHLREIEGEMASLTAALKTMTEGCHSSVPAKVKDNASALQGALDAAKSMYEKFLISVEGQTLFLEAADLLKEAQMRTVAWGVLELLNRKGISHAKKGIRAREVLKDIYEEHITSGATEAYLTAETIARVEEPRVAYQCMGDRGAAVAMATGRGHGHDCSASVWRYKMQVQHAS